MATRVRLQRHGKKGRPIYHIVAADSRAKRDGKFIEKIGVYNPNTNPATIDMDFEKALYWVKVGAEMSPTAKAILSYRGVLTKNHLDKGVTKGAMTQEQADARFAKWMEEKDAKVQAKRDKLKKSADDTKRQRLSAEKEYSNNRVSSRVVAEAPAAPEQESAE